jgi:leucine dehydrogenase
MQITEKTVPGYERIVCAVDEAAGYRAIIVVHNTALGPAVGGTRFWRYANQDAALTDALRLARGMTYKNSLAGLPFGGGKSVIMAGDTLPDREQIFRAHGRVIESLGGQYVTGEDVGTSTGDMEIILRETSYVGGLQNRSGDPSPRTARGVFRAMQAAAKFRWSSDNLSGKTVAIQGCGHVGHHLGAELYRAGARLIVTDVEESRMQRMADDHAAETVSPSEIYSVKADIFAPCALGGVINDQTIPQLQVEMIVGGANNQLLEPRHGDLLEQRGILYAPDYAANAGGVINGCCIEMMGWDGPRTMAKIDSIYDTLLQIFTLAQSEGIPSYQAADRLAEQRLRKVDG